MSELKLTPLDQVHRSLGAQMAPFAGWAMPVAYQGIVAEHKAVRQQAGLFDISHMGEFTVSGPEAETALQRLTTDDVSRLAPGQIQYSLLCQEDGGVVDDILVYRLSPAAAALLGDPEALYLLVVNAANCERDYTWISQHLGGARVQDLSANLALLALQGPSAAGILQPLVNIDLAGLGYYHATTAIIKEIPVFLSRTGYTGEDGFEIMMEANHGVCLWQTLLEAGAASGLVPVGLGARDTLRLEAGYCLYGHELTESTNPLEARLGWVVAWDKGDFIGREALAHVRAQGPKRQLIGLLLAERAVPRAGYAVVDLDGKQLGVITSGSFSPTCGQGIALAYLDPAWAKPGTEVAVQIRNRLCPAQVVKPPFIQKGVK